ncbi:hypothetical protein fugu_007618 [Takifugu bimaculatus]|uniref:SUN domain-containing protein n=1 Tax=Takifugu bimaculatus TaxID=433685 RepID=A0A4Z2AZJ0_9TELE|nr:hypothetical protein fugu_007618 [Takifugu bimaculatus]
MCKALELSNAEASCVSVLLVSAVSSCCCVPGPAMLRRSSRLQAGNYYAMSNGLNSTPAAAISYYETPVRSSRKSRVRASRQKSPSPFTAKGPVPESSSTTEPRRRSRITEFFFDLKPNITTSRHTKACALLLLFLVLFCVGFLLLLLTSITPNNLLMIDLSLTKKLPVHFDPSLQNSNMNLRPIYEKEYQELQERIAGIEKATRLHLERKIADLAMQILGVRTVATSLSHRIRSVEDQNLKLTKEWKHLEQRPDGNSLTPELQRDIEGLFRKLVEELAVLNGGGCSECRRPIADKMADFALESQGASVISSRCSQTYTSTSGCLTLFGIPLWSLFTSPRTAIQGSPILAGTCWCFVGAEGTLAVSLSHPVKITHVTVDHLPSYNSPSGDIKSAPKDFEVHGMKTQAGEGTFLGKFLYDKFGEPTQTFSLPTPTDQSYDIVELRVFSNWGQKEYTCLYRFRVHGQTDVS